MVEVTGYIDGRKHNLIMMLSHFATNFGDKVVV